MFDIDRVFKYMNNMTEHIIENKDKEANIWLTINQWFDCIIHETAHTIETRLDLFDYHEMITISNKFKIDFKDSYENYYKYAFHQYNENELFLQQKNASFLCCLYSQFTILPGQSPISLIYGQSSFVQRAFPVIVTILSPC